ncbi:hypothetical protein Terro_2990 [Terriglobus roseus DSM 18391]|uniref:Uncharacterized protein n=1 Tax=Terriglobus roseus (strain DSM 18391 / NRRL B-41598 / KBS 63) TaxID=926566 RepID=I3ZJ04_TERRK|nr:hypothetical protein [Terriglobus roseus]AFL89222.1 hypothetical protein Terro_2990 [Terriglobus roseus DSM 18391]
MQVLNPEEAKRFLIANNLGEHLTRLAPDTFRTEVTKDVGRRCAYANMLTNHLVTSEGAIACLDITDWDVWPLAQNMDLFYSYRRYLGERRSLKDAHFHVFTAAEANEFRNILHLGLISHLRCGRREHDHRLSLLCLA